MPLHCRDTSIVEAFHAGRLLNMPVIRLILRHMDVDIDVDKTRLCMEAPLMTENEGSEVRRRECRVVRRA